MIRLTHEDFATLGTPHGLTERQAEMYRRARRLDRHAVRAYGKALGGGEDYLDTEGLEYLLVEGADDLATGSALFTRVGLGDRPAAELLDYAEDLRNVRHWRWYELLLCVTDTSATTVFLPKETPMPRDLRETLRLGLLSATTVPTGALRGTLDRQRGALGRSVVWVRFRPAEGVRRGFDLRVRLRGGPDTSDIRTFLPADEFPDAATVAGFVRAAVGEGVHYI